ncbi:hypothetical protein CFC21_082802 [Triticum aestivum]|uniref:Uncharacterized protein n=3 Tax=Triticum TaxID=4564 RepID=A0A9R0XX74_TRITD|nr:hypothetical protein CFC21_082802 [Triticum aestivum]VAI44239.1 unnamed protein product [Triticum turgidum subsp. durum]
MASVMARQTTYCIRGSLRASFICDVNENMRQPGGDSHTFFDLPAKHQLAYIFDAPLPLNCTSVTHTTPTGTRLKRTKSCTHCVTRSCVDAILGDQSIHLPKRRAWSAPM